MTKTYLVVSTSNAIAHVCLYLADGDTPEEAVDKARTNVMWLPNEQPILVVPVEDLPDGALGELKIRDLGLGLEQLLEEAMEDEDDLV